jgi:hypothetical protein
VKPSRAVVWTLGAIVILAAALLFAWQIAKRRAIEASAHEEAANRATPALPAIPPPRADSIAADATGSAERWRERAERVVRAKNARLFNADVARLLDLPPDQAWHALVDRALAGDLAAGTAALQIAILCNTLSPGDGYVNGTRPNTARRLHAKLSPSWQNFLDAIETRSRDDLRQRIGHCDGVSGATDFALLMLDHFLEPTDPDVQLEIARDEEDDARAIADLREIAAKHPAANTKRALGERLMESTEPAARAEGRAALEALAADDADAVIALAFCAGQSPSMGDASAFAFRPCHAFDDDPAGASQWIERAAGLGDHASLMRWTAKLANDGRTVDAWAWSLYRLDLAMRGCFEIGRPDFVYLGLAADGEEELRKTLDAKQENAGRAIANEIAGRWTAEATARLDCGD